MTQLPAEKDPTIWHYALNGQQLGPVNAHQFRSLIASGQLNAQSLVWREGFPNWLPALQVPELIGHNSTLSTQALNPQNQSALISMILGITGLVLSLSCYGLGCIFSIPAVILGHKAKKQIAESTPQQTGHGMAQAGVITGYVGIGITLLILLGIGAFALFTLKTTTP